MVKWSDTDLYVQIMKLSQWAKSSIYQWKSHMEITHVLKHQVNISCLSLSLNYFVTKKNEREEFSSEGHTSTNSTKIQFI